MKDKYKHIIIAGATKSATSGLFTYLGDHPEICPSSVKETRFFLDESYPVRIMKHFDGNIDTYNGYFIGEDSAKLSLEATPDYIYSKDSAKRISSVLTDVCIIVILREPIARLVSWYNFAKQENMIPANMTFSAYIKAQQKDKANNAPLHLRVLENGKYYDYLMPYFETFGENNILITFFEDLKEDATSLLKKICIKCGINPSFYDNYEIKVINKTMNVKSAKLHRAFKLAQYNVNKYTHRTPYIQGMFRRVKKIADPIYTKLIESKAETPIVDDDQMRFLEHYYAESIDQIQALIKQKATWYY